jgi:hypothetical protein
MNGTSTITINTVGVSDEQKTTAKFQTAYRDMLAQLSAPGFADILCAHEAAHAIYFRLAGNKEFDTVPARLEYDPATDDYKGSLAAIRLRDLPSWTPGQFREWLFGIARGHAAGGVVARKLMPSSDGGDQNDKERFREVCDAINKDPNVKIDCEQWWKTGQEAVAADLENPEVMDAILRQAAELKPQFGL